MKKEIGDRDKAVKRQQEEVGKFRCEERHLDEERRKQQITVEEARSSTQSNRTRGKVRVLSICCDLTHFHYGKTEFLCVKIQAFSQLFTY